MEEELVEEEEDEEEDEEEVVEVEVEVDVREPDAVDVDEELADEDSFGGSLAEDADLGEGLDGDGDGDIDLGSPVGLPVFFPLGLSYSANRLVEVPVTTSESGAQVSSLTDEVGVRVMIAPEDQLRVLIDPVVGTQEPPIV